MSRTLLAFVLLAACATPFQPFEGRPVLAEIKFEGNKSVSSKDLLSHIATAPTSGFFSKTARYYDPDLFAIDIKRIERWYNLKGFYQAKVADVHEDRDDEGRVTLVVKIDEGPRAFVRKLDLVGLDQLPRDELNDIRDELPLHPGDGFDEDVYDKSKDVLQEQLRAHGFAQAKTRGRVEVAPEEGAAHIVLEADPGQRFTFGTVNVSGNRRVAADEIAFATGINRGDRYSPAALALAQQRVYNLGTFSGVRVGTDPLGDPPVANVRVNVREAPFQTVRFGIGGSAEETRWEIPRVRAEYTNRSLLGGLRRLELANTVGYAFVPNPFPGQYDPSRSGITDLSTAQITIPNVFRPGLDWVNRGEFAREVQNGFSYDDVAGRTGLVYRRGSHTVGGSLNYVHYFNVSVSGTQDLSTNTGLFLDCSKGCTLTYPELRYSFDGRDNVIEPTQGFFFSIGLQQTLKPGSFSYFRINPDLRTYTSLGRFGVLALRTLYGGMFTEMANGVTPFTQRFFFGGQNEQRGYSSLQQGPKLAVTPCKVGTTPGCDQPYATETTPIGGNAAILFAGELRIHADTILDHLMVVPFVDASSVGDDPKRPLDNGLEVAIGLGLRYITPFGPIRLDFGYLLNPRDVIATNTDSQGNIISDAVPTRVSAHCPNNNAGCIHQSRWGLHITIGEAF